MLSSAATDSLAIYATFKKSIFRKCLTLWLLQVSPERLKFAFVRSLHSLNLFLLLIEFSKTFAFMGIQFLHLLVMQFFQGNVKLSMKYLLFLLCLNNLKYANNLIMHATIMPFHCWWNSRVEKLNLKIELSSNLVN